MMGTACLLYGIVFSPAEDHAGDHAPPALPPGVDGAPVRLIEEGGLGAAISWIEPPDLTPNISRALSYAKVVEALHADRAVLPMRYGCLFGDEGEVVELLRARRAEYAAVLRRLDGCVEMGVRILRPAEPVPPCSPFDPETEAAPGQAYLAHRAARYAREQATAGALANMTGRVRRALGGLAERTETDSAVRGDQGVSSLYFLVKRTAVESFRQAFRRIGGRESSRLLLSGPWPPYNFVTPARDEGQFA